jgi:hypothetical protein
MDKKLNSLDALASIKFENLAPDPVPTDRGTHASIY